MLEIKRIGGDAAADTGLVEFGFLAVFDVPTRDPCDQGEAASSVEVAAPCSMVFTDTPTLPGPDSAGLTGTWSR
jgi:hypothetical protein